MTTRFHAAVFSSDLPIVAFRDDLRVEVNPANEQWISMLRESGFRIYPEPNVPMNEIRLHSFDQESTWLHITIGETE